VQDTYRKGLLIGIALVVSILLVSIGPLEDLLCRRTLPYPPPPETSFLTYLYFWRASALLLVCAILTLIVLYIRGKSRLLVGILDAQLGAFVLMHYLYLASIMETFHEVPRLLPMIYYLNGVPHLDIGQIAALYLVIRVIYVLRARARNRVTYRTSQQYHKH